VFSAHKRIEPCRISPRSARAESRQRVSAGRFREHLGAALAGGSPHPQRDGEGGVFEDRKAGVLPNLDDTSTPSSARASGTLRLSIRAYPKTRSVGPRPSESLPARAAREREPRKPRDFVRG